MVRIPFVHVFISFFFFVGIQSGGYAQGTRSMRWSDSSLTLTSRSLVAYHPEPIIFVHGITSSRLNWEDVIENLAVSNKWFEAYHYVPEAVTNQYESTSPPATGYGPADFRYLPAKETNQWQRIELPFLHTFNYGRHAKVGPTNDLPYETYINPSAAKSNLPVRISRQSHDPVEWNSWQAPTGDYLANRTTLRQRIDEIRNA